MIRQVGTESSRTYEKNLANGFFKTYMSGIGLDVGFAGYNEGAQSILPGAIGIDLDYPGYDGRVLPFPDNSQDYVYNSHCLEHITHYNAVIRDWHRVTKIGGHVIIVVPHQFLYEKKAFLPSRWNEDHKRFYTPSSLLREVEESLKPNSYRVRFLADGDDGFDYNILPEPHSIGQYEITLVIQKITTPTWEIK